MPDAAAAAEPVPAAPAVAAERHQVPATPSDAAARGYRAYRADLACYQAWCAQEGRAAAIPAAPEAVGAYLAALAPRYGLATLRRRLALLARAHSGEGVRHILLRRAAEAGVEGTWLEPVSPHGLRAGFVTQATKAGLPDEAIMDHTRHRDAKTMRRYVRRARLLDDSPARKLGP